jgi:NAD(P)-dependent dehydrogenase (short-subunit alcohol dehydrogenase family)
MEKYLNKKIVVTGSAAGVGQIIAIDFAQEGAYVILVDLKKPEKTIELIAQNGGKADFVICDISNEEQVIEMAAHVKGLCGGKIDILINNAGCNGKVNLVKDMKLSDWQFTLGINLTGTMMVTRELIPFLIENKEGKIVNIASNVARRGLPYRSDYVCSKWALLGLTQTLALELVGNNIRVNAVCPGPIEGDRIEQIVQMHAEVEKMSVEDMHKAWENVPMKRFVKPGEVSSVVRFLCSEESSAMTGQALNVTGGFIMT